MVQQFTAIFYCRFKLILTFVIYSILHLHNVILKPNLCEKQSKNLKPVANINCMYNIVQSYFIHLQW